VACPYFMPTEKIEDAAWIHPTRLPLGSGWTGHCTAPGHEGELPCDQQIRECCNLGYASSCGFRPVETDYDSVRFAVIRETDDHLTLCYVREKNHLPADHGTLEYDKRSPYLQPHSDPRVRRMAECYLASYFLRKGNATTTAVASS
jgi:hypothetical protein